MSMTLFHRVLEANAVYKRFNERWVADPGFREALSRDPEGTLERHGIACRPEDVRAPSEGGYSAATRAMWQIVQTKSRWVKAFYRGEGAPVDPRIRAFRERQIARQWLDLGPFHTRSNIHASLSIELTKGCSVGCWFCALSPGRLSAVFRHDDRNQALFRGVLCALQDSLGPAAKTGFLYWATDPLDNPDYERFCLDFHETIGVFPPTTTALPLRDPARTRALLVMSEARGCWLNRFSILSIKQLDAVHAEFTAEELSRVECLPLNRDSAFAFSNAGRFRDRVKKDPGLLDKQRKTLRWAPWYTGDPSYAGVDAYPLASIGCVTGFLLNMCDRSVQLISPCTADERRPLGYIVHDEATFEDETTLAAELCRMIDEAMSPVVRPDDRPRFHDWLHYEELPDGFRLVGRFKGHATFEGEGRSSAWRALGDLVRGAGKTAAEITHLVAGIDGVGPDAAQEMLDDLLRAGVLDEVDG